MKRILLLFVSAIFCLFITAQTLQCSEQRAAQKKTRQAPSKSAAVLGTIGAQLPDVAESAVHSVVNISSIRVVRFRDRPSPFFDDPLFRFFFGDNYSNPFGVPRERRQRSLGSGVIVSADGYVVTNNHVVENADEVLVSITGGKEYKAKIIGTDSRTDVALLRIPKSADLKPIALGDSDNVRLGEVVVAIGSPFGLQQTVTMGIISAKGRANVGIVDYEDFIQTDAAINPGNSGGALVNMQSQLIGINSAIYSRSGGYQGIGFAIPINMVKWIMENLIDNGRIDRGWLGLGTQVVDQEIARAVGLESPQGAIVVGLAPRGPAAKSGLQRGDVIISYNNQRIKDAAQLRNLVVQSKVGSTVHLRVLREKQKITLSVVVAAEPKQLQRR